MKNNIFLLSFFYVFTCSCDMNIDKIYIDKISSADKIDTYADEKKILNIIAGSYYNKYDNSNITLSKNKTFIYNTKNDNTLRKGEFKFSPSDFSLTYKDINLNTQERVVDGITEYEFFYELEFNNIPEDDKGSFTGIIIKNKDSFILITSHNKRSYTFLWTKNGSINNYANNKSDNDGNATSINDTIETLTIGDEISYSYPEKYRWVTIDQSFNYVVYETPNGSEIELVKKPHSLQIEFIKYNKNGDLLSKKNDQEIKSKKFNNEINDSLKNSEIETNLLENKDRTKEYKSAKAKSKRVYFWNIENGSKKNKFIIKDDLCTVKDEKDDFSFITYHNKKRGTTTEGWVKTAELVILKKINSKIEKNREDINPQKNNDSIISASLIIGSFGSLENAKKLKKELVSEGYKNIEISKIGSVNRVSILLNDTKKNIKETQLKIKKTHKGVWISYK